MEKKKSFGHKLVNEVKNDLGIEKSGKNPEKNRYKLRYNTYAYYCPSCGSMKEAVKVFSWGWFIFWTVITAGIGGIIYIIYYASKSKTKCPICHTKIAKSNHKGIYTNKDKL